MRFLTLPAILPGLLIYLGLIIIYSDPCEGKGVVPIRYALSPAYLKYLETAERDLYTLLKKNENESGNGTALVKRYLSEYEQMVLSLRKIKKNAAVAANITPIMFSNPLTSFQMVNRFVKYFKDKDFSAVAREVLKASAIPAEKEVTDTMRAILVLQYIYGLNASDIASGRIWLSKTSASLSTSECYRIGKFAQSKSYFTLALQWYDLVLNRLRNSTIKGDGKSPTSKSKEDMILKAINETVEEHNQNYTKHCSCYKEGNIFCFQWRLQLDSLNYSEIADQSLQKRLVETMTGMLVDDKRDSKYNQANLANMMALCKGRDLQPRKVKSKLRCYYDTKRHAYWAINPLKIEQLSLDPLLLLIYEVLSDTWNKYLVDKAYSKLGRPLGSYYTSERPTAFNFERTPAIASFNDSQIPKAPLWKIFEAITNLNVKEKDASGPLQVAAYACGAHEDPYVDPMPLEDFELNIRETGDRIATVILFLNEVKRGGLTVFPALGIHVKPIKNSALLWYTGSANGWVDDRLVYAACPVILGQKWVAQKDMYMNANIFRRPCGLSRMD